MRGASSPKSRSPLEDEAALKKSIFTAILAGLFFAGA
jgi:hypothetical protein